MESFLAEVGFTEWNHLQDAGRPFSEAVVELCTRYPHYCSLISAYDQRYPESLNGPIQGTVDILRRLQHLGHPLYALSNWPAEKFALVRPRYPFLDWFDGIVISGEVGIAKPDARIFLILLERVGRPATECLFIDDSPINVAVAQSIGFQTIHFCDPAQLEAELNLRSLLPAAQAG